MDPILSIQLVVVLLLVLGNAFFVGSEIALTSARRSRIKQLADGGHASAQIVEQLHAFPERFYSVTQIGITLVSLCLGALGIATVTTCLEPALDFTTKHLDTFIPPSSAHHVAQVAAHLLAFAVVSYLHIVGGELAPKVLAFRRSVEVSLIVARPITVMYRMLAWAIWFLNVSANGLLWIFGHRHLTGAGGSHFSVSEEELRTILATSEEEGVLKPHETKMIHGVFDLDEKSASDLRIAANRIVALPNTATVGEAFELFCESKHSRYPVYNETINSIVGILFIKELLESMHAGDNPALLQCPIVEIMRQPYFVHESTPINGLLSSFKSNHRQMAIVCNDSGSTVGLVTLEDILQQIVGDY